MKWQSQNKMIGVETNLIETYRLIPQDSKPTTLILNERLSIIGDDARNLYAILDKEFGQSKKIK